MCGTEPLSARASSASGGPSARPGRKISVASEVWCRGNSSKWRGLSSRVLFAGGPDGRIQLSVDEVLRPDGAQDRRPEWFRRAIGRGRSGRGGGSGAWPCGGWLGVGSRSRVRRRARRGDLGECAGRCRRLLPRPARDGRRRRRGVVRRGPGQLSGVGRDVRRGCVRFPRCAAWYRRRERQGPSRPSLVRPAARPAVPPGRVLPGAARCQSKFKLRCSC